MNDTIVMLALKQLTPSPTNPRKRFDQAALEDLAASIRTDGLLSPIVVRPTVATQRKVAAKASYEIVAGERRYRAATLAEIKEVPCIARELSDDDVLRIQVVENLQREDVHPLEEAAGFKALLDRGLFDVAGISGKIGKGEPYVRSRLALANLQGLARRAMEEDLLNMAHALRIAPLSGEDQDSATVFVLGTQDPGGELRMTRYSPVSAADLKRWIQRDLTPDLAVAPFDKADPTLNPAMGPCDGCQFRTINTLFVEEGDEDRCLKRPCFDVKLTTHVARERERAPEGTLQISSEYNRGGEGVIDPRGYSRISTAPIAQEAAGDDRLLAWAEGLERADGHEVYVGPRSFERMFGAIDRLMVESLQGLDEEEEADQEPFERLREERASGLLGYNDEAYRLSEDGPEWEGLDEAPTAPPPLPDDARMALLVDGPEAGKLVPIRLYSQGREQATMIENPEAVAAAATEERRARKEQLRLQRAEMIARRRALDAILAALEAMGAKELEAFGKRHVLDLAAIAAVKLARQDTNVWDSKDPKDGRHPGRDGATAILGLATYRHGVNAQEPDERTFERPLLDVVKALAVGATSDEIHVGEGYAGEGGRNQAFALFGLCCLLMVDLEAIRGQADWDTLSKGQRAEREKEANGGR